MVPELHFIHSQLIIGLQERRGFLPPPLTNLSVPYAGKGLQFFSPGLCCKAMSASNQEEKETLANRQLYLGGKRARNPYVSSRFLLLAFRQSKHKPREMMPRGGEAKPRQGMSSVCQEC